MSETSAVETPLSTDFSSADSFHPKVSLHFKWLVRMFDRQTGLIAGDLISECSEPVCRYRRSKVHKAVPVNYKVPS